MRKFFNKSYIVLIALFCVLLTACQVSSEGSQEETKSGFQEQPSQTLQVTHIEKKALEQPSEKIQSSAFKLPDDVFIIEISRGYDGNQEALTLKNDLLQFWVNENVICEKQIPIPAKVLIGANFYEVIGNPYISEEGELVLIQSYTTPEGKQKLDYTILITNCNKIITSFNYDAYVFQDYEGKYGLAFYGDNPLPWYPYAGFAFDTVDSNFTLPKPTIIWLNNSTVRNFDFFSWVSESESQEMVSDIFVRLYVESYGELYIAEAVASFKAVKVDDKFFDLIHERFLPEEYNERFFKLIQIMNGYKQKS